VRNAIRDPGPLRASPREGTRSVESGAKTIGKDVEETAKGIGPSRRAAPRHHDEEVIPGVAQERQGATKFGGAAMRRD